ncbi:hypothetical protein WCU24_07020 [Pseudomonas aeruginosa]|uniref:hypothetical protein n=1 Tax=Pseudomonas aeruginosa TaxID=287 RepID=UPI0030D4CDC0
MSAEKPRERPILFNDQMVRAILDGRKTVTRRVMKPQPVLDGHFWTYGGAGWSDRINSLTPVAGHSLAARCPYGQPGDRLWVREAWGLQVRSYGGGAGEFIVYRATNPDAIYCKSSEGREYPVKWKPSIHMRRHSSRILLEITAVRVKRLQDISEEEALAEGVRGEPCDHTRQACADIGCWGDTAKGAFGFLWESLNGEGSWAANPWVWVVEFKRVTP